MKKDTRTLLDALKDSLAASSRSSEGMASPVAVLWTDAGGQWASLLPTLRAALPYFYTFGKYDPETRTGPSIWLKCIVDRSLPEAPPSDQIPILYLSRVSRQDLRAAGDCPPQLQPLVELQFRGRVWHQPSGQDWTVMAFLVSEDGLGLEIAGDRRTEEAFLRALPMLAESDTRALKGRRLDADDFDKLSVQDPVRDLLLWLNNPEAFEASAKGGRWEAFRGLCQSEFGIDPGRLHVAEVATLLLRGEMRLDRVWDRFVEAPQLYSGVIKRLREPMGLGQGSLQLDPSRDPRINEREEIELRSSLESVATLPHKVACERVMQLEALHAPRRDWLWARMGESPWAVSLQPLSKLAMASENPVGGSTLSAAAAAYAGSGYQCDSAAMEALASFRSGPEANLVARVVRGLYEPWLDKSARHFQTLVVAEPQELRKEVTQPTTDKDTCLLFVDGLRFDLAERLASQLEAKSLKVRTTHRLAPLPTVTATAKPVASPITKGVEGRSGENFTPLIQTKSGWKPLTAPLLRERLENQNVEVLASDETSIPLGADGGAWTECGLIDALGHNLQGELPNQLTSELDRISDRILGLTEAGWRRVRVVTDHGWLLLPGGLPKVDLPSYLVETKWARCAVVKGQSTVAVPESSWYWNADIRIASPPGIASFRAGEVYAHGGISPQECVVPELFVERGSSESYATIQSVEWRGMRCRVRVDSNEPRMKVDLRTNWKQAGTSIVIAPKEIGGSGEVNLAVADDSNEGAAASVVIVDPDGKVIATKNTSVGE